MKKVLYIALLSLLCLLPLRGHASAQCQTDDSKYGAVTLQAPTLPTTGSYTIWTRLQVPNADSNQYRLEVNNNACYEVGGSSIDPGSWQWVSFQDGDLSHSVSFDFQKVSGNTLKLIGTDAGVKIDRVLLAKTDCIPVDLGENCETDNTAVAAVSSGATEVPPPSSGAVSGLIVPSTSITQDPSSIAKVVYFSDSTSLPTATNFALDTTLLSNGIHRISIQITKTDGTVTNEATTLQVNNKVNALSPIKRWVRLNQGTAVTISSITGGVLIVIAALLIIRHLRLNKRLLEFHGF